jgi:hypothetical protein
MKAKVPVIEQTNKWVVEFFDPAYRYVRECGFAEENDALDYFLEKKEAKCKKLKLFKIEQVVVKTEYR